LVAVGALFVAAGCGRDVGQEDAVPFIRAERPAFEAARAYEDLLTQVAFGPRIPGTDGHAEQLEWMLTELAQLADTVFTEPFSHTTREGVELDLTNVMARFGRQESRRILLLTHWDTRPRSDRARNADDRELPVPGANDGASGTAILLGLARLFRQQPPPVGVDLLFVDGEDYGPSTADMFLGARHYADNRAVDDAPLFGILLDMVGDADPLFPVEAYSAEAAPQVVQRVWGIAQQLGYRRYFPLDATQRVLDDHIPLNDVGIPTIDIIDFDYGPGNGYWHTPDDVAANTSPETLRMVGEVVAELVYRQQ
jgi:Peptidase family M28